MRLFRKNSKDIRVGAVGRSEARTPVQIVSADGMGDAASASRATNWA